MIKELILRHCAETVYGIKTGSLFSANLKGGVLNELFSLENKLAKLGIKIAVLKGTQDKIWIYLYNPSMLEKDLCREKSRKILVSCGYKDFSVNGAISKLRERFRVKTAAADFPHEMGLFLGYPADDVEGFIKNKGENYLFTGYWKVYSNERRARKIFDDYTKCRKYARESFDFDF